MKQLKFSTDLVTGRLSEDSAKKYFSRFGWFAFAFTLILSLSQTAIVLAVQALAPSWLGNTLFNELLSVISIYAISFPLALLILAPLPTVTPVKEKLGIKELFCMLCICEALMIIGNFVSSLALSAFDSALGGVNLENPVSASVDSQPMWITIVFTVILAPVLEEIFFRGLICKKLLILGEGYAIVLSSAFFALCHGNFFQLFYAFTVGCFFGFIYVKTGKLLYTVICHICVNLLGTVVVTAIMNYADLDSLMSENPVISSENIVGILLFSVYEIIIFAAVAFGIYLLFKNKKRIKFDSGLLSPPAGGKGAACVFLNFGVAAAIAVFALTLLGSLMI